MLADKISQDLSQAQKRHDKIAISALRMLLSEIHNQEIAKARSLSDDEINTVINHEVKKRQEAIEQFEQGGRKDLVEQEQAELLVLKNYLPEPLSEERLLQEIRQAITEAKATGPQAFGQVMKLLMAKVKGRASGARVSQMVKQELSQQNGN